MTTPAFTMVLHCPGNPDWGQYAPLCPPIKIEAKSIDQLVDRVRTTIADIDLGGGNFAPDPILDHTGQPVGRMSYNGKIWPLEPWKPGMHPIYEPGYSSALENRGYDLLPETDDE